MNERIEPNDIVRIFITMRPSSSQRNQVMTRRVFNTGIRGNRLPFTRPQPGKVEVYGAIIHSRSTDKYCLVEGKSSGKWSFPKGHVKTGESPFECVGREIGEEIGIDNLPMPQKGLPLRVGYYYVFEIPNEWELVPRDLNEIGSAGWYSLAEMESMNLNIDASTFRSMNSRSNAIVQAHDTQEEPRFVMSRITRH